jgi:hypothetical protein
MICVNINDVFILKFSLAMQGVVRQGKARQGKTEKARHEGDYRAGQRNSRQ